MRNSGHMRLWQNTITIISIAAALILAAWAASQPGRWQTVAAYRTSLAQRTPSQVHNVKLAIKEINGRMIPGGAEFSFNRTVGSWNAQRGYVKAPVSYDGELIPAFGGGVCQASSTLYNAALLSGMKITERHRHHFPARYTPPGQDAAVAQYNIDLRFKNPYKWPVKIECETSGDFIVCRILSQKTVNQKISVEREIRQVTSPVEVIRSTGSGSHRRVVNHGQPGLCVAVYRRVKEGGKTTRTLISQDTYPPMNRLVED